MIVIRSVDLASGRVEVADLGRRSETWNADLLRLAERMRQVGMRELTLREGRELRTLALFSSGPRTTAAGGTALAAQPYLLKHRWALHDDWPVYDARFRHIAGCLAQLSSYCAVLLYSYGQQSTHLMQLRLAMYEICANVVEHGLQNRTTGEIDLQLRFQAERIEGWVQDDCLRFDPSQKLLSPPPVSAARRSARGYGIHIIRELLDDLGHEFNETGNRITFMKRISK